MEYDDNIDVGTASVTINGTGNYAGSSGSASFVIKAVGAEVNTPTLNEITHDSITINPVTALGNGQSVEYGINTIDEPPSAWQTELIFNDLNAGTAYYIFAR